MEEEYSREEFEESPGEPDLETLAKVEKEYSGRTGEVPEDLPESIPTAVTWEKTWITDTLQANYSLISDHFHEYPKSKANATYFFSGTLKKFNIPVPNIRVFNEILSKQSESDQISFVVLIKSMLEWAKVTEKTLIAQSLTEKISEFRDLLRTFPTDRVSKSVTQEIINDLSKGVPQLDSLPSLETQEAPTAPGILNEIFAFYTRSQAIIGKNPSFAQISSTLSVLTLPEYLKFCVDFSFLAKSPALSKSEATSVFKSHASFTRSMDFPQFLSSLLSLAKLYFNKNYDEANNTSTSQATDAEKLGFLYQLMETENQAKCLSKVKGFGTSLNKEQVGFRVPANQLNRKNKHKGRLAEHNKETSNKGKLVYPKPLIKPPAQTDNSKTISLQSLTEVKAHDLGEEEFLDSILSPHLRSALKAHDEKLEKGLRVVKKHQSQTRV